MRKVFLDTLPKGGKFVKDNAVNWKESIGYKVHFIYEDIEGDVEIVDVQSPYLFIKYDDYELFKIKNVNFIYCKFGKMLNKITSEFKIEVGTRFKNDKRDITITDRKMEESPYRAGSYLKYYKYKCNLCEFDGGKHWSIKDKKYKDEFWIEESNLLKENGVGCSCCCKNPQIVVENINSIYHTNKWMIPYIGEECAKTHTYNSTDEIHPICPYCGLKKKSKMEICTIHIEHSIGCCCNDGVSIPNKIMFNILEQLNIQFETEYSPKWISPKRYDFYISSMNLIIEMDGGFHNKDNSMSGQTKEDSKNTDNEKDRLARTHEIEVIRIDCDYGSKDKIQYVKKNVITNIKLNKLFDLSNIDWLKCEEFTLSNLVKTACEYKNNNLEMTTTDIGRVMKLTPQAIWKYLKQGSKFGWCNYDPDSERRKGKRIICLDDNKIFNSVNETGMFYDINPTAIGKVCLGKLKTTKRRKFMYLKEYEEMNNRESLL